MRLLSWKRDEVDGHDYILYVDEGWIFKRRRHYIGSSTVWRTFPDMTRAGTSREMRLNDLWSWIQRTERAEAKGLA